MRITKQGRHHIFGAGNAYYPAPLDFPWKVEIPSKCVIGHTEEVVLLGWVNLLEHKPSGKLLPYIQGFVGGCINPGRPEIADPITPPQKLDALSARQARLYDQVGEILRGM